MNPHEISERSGEVAEPHESHISNQQQDLDAITLKSDRLRHELLKIADESKLVQYNELHIQNVFIQTVKALNQCSEARSNIRSTITDHQQLHNKYIEVQRRRDILHLLRREINAICQLRITADDIYKDQNVGELTAISTKCKQFETLNNHTTVPMDQRFKCLHTVSERVSVAVADSMRNLRESIRESCVVRDLSLFIKCYHSFDKLGAKAHFHVYLLQVFRDLADRTFRIQLEFDGTTPQKLLGYFTDMKKTLESLQWVLQIDSEDMKLNNIDDNFMDVRKRLLFLVGDTSINGLCFSYLSNSVHIIVSNKFSLIGETQSNLFHVLKSIEEFMVLMKESFPSCFDHNSRYPSTMGQGSDNMRAATQSVSNYPFLRRGHSNSRIRRNTNGNLNTSEETANGNVSDPFEQLEDSIKQIAFGSLSAIHARHAEELSVITKTPECWIRIRLDEKSVEEILSSLFTKSYGNTHKTRNKNSTSLDEEWAYDFFGSEAFETSAWTLTTASISILRWISEYISMGLTVPDTLSDALGNVKDLLLMLVYISIDMKSRADLSEQSPALKILEDALLERPLPKTIEDFIPLPLKQSFVCFQRRYEQGMHSQDSNVNDKNIQNWDIRHSVTLQNYSNAAGSFFSQPIQSQDSVIRQCVAAESIKTLCDILQPYMRHIETITDKKVEKLHGLSPQRMASLRSAITLGRAVTDAFYELLGWDIVGGWEAISAVIETCRAFHMAEGIEKDSPATFSSTYITEVCSRVKSAYHGAQLPPAAAERLGVVICASAMNIVVEGFSRVRMCYSTAAASQMLVDLNELASNLAEITGVTPCPGKERAEMFVKAIFLPRNEIHDWVERHRRRLKLSDSHIAALHAAAVQDDVPVFDQIVDP